MKKVFNNDVIEVSEKFCVVLFVSVCGCAPKQVNEENRIIFHGETENDELYKDIVFLDLSNTMNDLYNKRIGKFGEYNLRIGSSLVWQIEKNKLNVEKKYPVCMDIFEIELNSNVTGRQLLIEITNEISEEKEVEININEWIELSSDKWPTSLYHGMLTAEEIILLADKGVVCKYIGSGKGNIDDVDIGTDDGIDTFCELYGDQYILYRKNMKIYY